MDKQAALMKRYQKDEHTIAYVHNGDIVLIRKDVSKDSIQIVEIVMDSKTEVIRSRRTLQENEMSVSQFDMFKQTLTEETHTGFNADWRQTHLNVELDAILNTELVSESLVIDDEGELEEFPSTEINPIARTMENARKVLDEARLTEIQKRRFIQHHLYGKTTRAIAQDEGVNQSKIMKSLIGADKKIFRKEVKMGAQRAQKNYIGEGR